MKILFDKEKIQTTIEENRELTIPISVLVAAIILFVVFILPNILSFPSKKGARDVEITRLNQIKEAQRVLESTNEENLDSEVDLVSKVLPSDKNFELILAAITQAALNSNVQIASYLYSDTRPNDAESQKPYNEMVFEISIAGGIAEASRFVDELYSTYPISDVKSISYINGIAQIITSFYYSPFTSVSAKDAALARKKTPEESKAFESISSWEVLNVRPQFIEDIQATDSAEEIEPES